MCTTVKSKQIPLSKRQTSETRENGDGNWRVTSFVNTRDRQVTHPHHPASSVADDKLSSLH